MHTLQKRATGNTEGGDEVADEKFLFDQTTAGRIERQGKFLTALVEFGTIHAGCRAAGVTRACYYGWIEKHSEFKVAVEDAIENHADDLVQEVHKRAKDKSDLLLMFAVKKLRPEFKDNYREPVGKPEEEEAQGVAREDVEKRLNLLAERRIERLVTEGAKGKLKLERSEEVEEEDDPDVEVVVKRRKGA